ncbi:ATP-binding cassette domain-containing protein [Blautia obeum]|nr:ABC transporter ATP-binding protein [Blautia obeum]
MLYMIKDILNKRTTILLIISFIMLIANALLAPVILILSKKLIDYIAIPPAKKEMVVCIIIGYIIFQLLNEMLENIKNYIDSDIRYDMENIVNCKINTKIKKLQLKYFEMPQMYDVIERISTTVVQGIINSFDTIMGVLEPLLLLISYSITLFFIKWYFPVILLIMNIPYLVFLKKRNSLNYEQYKKLSREKRYANYWKNAILDKEFIKDIRVCEAYTYISNKWKKLILKIYNKEKKLILKIGKINTVIQIIRSFSLGICLIVTAVMVLKKEILIGSFVLVYEAVNSLNTNFTIVANQYGSIHELGMFLKDWELFNSFDEENPGNLGEIEFSDIRFKNVFYRYPNSKDYALKDINVEIKYGEKIGIVGKNGSGKSTFINLLLGLYYPEQGEITVDGHDIKNVLKAYRQKLMCMFQDFLKLPMKLEENLYVGRKRKIDDTTEYLQKRLGLKMNDILGNLDDKGRELSGGEWQSVALVRALLYKKELNIFDEPTSNLDSTTESKYLQFIKDKTENDTVIIVTHKLSLLQLCDRILVFKEGKIIQDGNYEEISKTSSEFKELLESQSSFFRSQM